MNPEINLFNVKSMNDELVKEFYNFFPKYDLLSLFTNEHKASPITVTDNDVRSVVQPHGKYNRDLKQFTDYLKLGQYNKTYEEAIFSLIEKPRSFQALMLNIRKIMRFIDSEIDSEHKFNTWNIVFYNKQVNL